MSPAILGVLHPSRTDFHNARPRTLANKQQTNNVVARRDIKFGKKPKLTKHQREEALARKRNGETLTEIAKSYNVSHMTICRLQV